METGTSLGMYSIGIGDRFGHQGVAQLHALGLALQAGVSLTPVWNKSNREHSIIGTTPGDTRMAADAAVREAGWKLPYYVDADHIGLNNVHLFAESSDFFTVDVADFIGKPAPASDVASYLDFVRKFRGRVVVPGLSEPLAVGDHDLEDLTKKYLLPIKEAGKIYRRIHSLKAALPFVTEISIDESSSPQSPQELFFILAGIAQEGIPVQTIAPKFSGQFLKGIDYVGSPTLFAREFESDLHIINFAVKEFGLPPTLKISVHSGSDKFSLYPVISRTIHKLKAGLHLKTAGTTWLEEIIGLAESGGEGLDIARRIYRLSFERIEELCKPYTSVVSIDRGRLPDPGKVNSWTSLQFVAALKHDQSNPSYNLHFRQLLHVGFKIAAELGSEYTRALDLHRDVVGRNVTENLWNRHLVPLFM
jgi:tagaturonate epimerase